MLNIYDEVKSINRENKELFLKYLINLEIEEMTDSQEPAFVSRGKDR